MTAIFVSRGQKSFNFKIKMTVQETCYQYICALIPCQHRKDLYASVYVHDTAEVAESIIQGQNTTEQRNEGDLTDLESFLVEQILYAQIFQKLHKLVVKSASAAYGDVSHANKRAVG